MAGALGLFVAPTIIDAIVTATLTDATLTAAAAGEPVRLLLPAVEAALTNAWVSPPHPGAVLSPQPAAPGCSFLHRPEPGSPMRPLPLALLVLLAAASAQAQPSTPLTPLQRGPEALALRQIEATPAAALPHRGAGSRRRRHRHPNRLGHGCRHPGPAGLGTCPTALQPGPFLLAAGLLGGIATTPKPLAEPAGIVQRLDPTQS